MKTLSQVEMDYMIKALANEYFDWLVLSKQAQDNIFMVKRAHNKFKDAEKMFQRMTRHITDSALLFEMERAAMNTANAWFNLNQQALSKTGDIRIGKALRY